MDNNSETNDRVGLGMIAGFLLGIMGLFAGAFYFWENVYERKTFIKGWIVGFIISLVLIVVIISLIYFRFFDNLSHSYKIL